MQMKEVFLSALKNKYNADERCFCLQETNSTMSGGKKKSRVDRISAFVSRKQAIHGRYCLEEK